MQLYSTASNISAPSMQKAGQRQQANAKQSLLFNGIKAPAQIRHDEARFSGKQKYKDLNTSASISAPEDLYVRDSEQIGGLEAGGKIVASEVAVKGDVIAKGDINYQGSNARGIVKSWLGNIYTDYSEGLGGLHAPQGNIKAKEVAIRGGSVVADKGTVEFIGSDIYGDGEIKAGDTATVTRSANINGIHAGNDIVAYDIAAKNDVISDQGSINFKESDAWRKLQALQGKIQVENADLIGSIDSAQTVDIKGLKEIQGPIEAGDDVTLRNSSKYKRTVVKDVLVHSGKSEQPNLVDIGPDVTVEGDIHFDNGQGTVLLREGSSFEGKTNGEIESDKKGKDFAKRGLLGGLFNRSGAGSSKAPALYPAGQNGSQSTLSQPPAYDDDKKPMYLQDNSSNRTITGTHPPLRNSSSFSSIATFATTMTLPAYGDNSKSKPANPETGLPEEDDASIRRR
ncbi:MAG: hypothetical protein K0Q50_1609 [Vampirovibrio sp.]|jgi:cytoskeletal protein CcmA (bactofilin family)|nr:hypothetical protein [Vampirovibrio sp.]